MFNTQNRSISAFFLYSIDNTHAFDTFSLLYTMKNIF